MIRYPPQFMSWGRWQAGCTAACVRRWNPVTVAVWRVTMNTRATFVVLLLCASSSINAGAEPFTVFPDRSVVFNVSYATAGVFECRTALCTGSGTNSVTR